MDLDSELAEPGAFAAKVEHHDKSVAALAEETSPPPVTVVTARPLSPFGRVLRHAWLGAVLALALLIQTVSPDVLSWLPASPGLPGAAQTSGGDGGVLRAPVVLAASLPGDVVTRAALPQTIIPERPRRDVITYTVQPGDTLFGIAYQFGLQPETILWSNPDLQDNPHLLDIGQTLNILPVDGVYHSVTVSDTLASMAEAFHVDADAIRFASWNRPYIGKDGTLTVGANLVVPGGSREIVVWVIQPLVPGGTPGTLNGTANVGGCGTALMGMGTGHFIWPTDSRWVSGNPYAVWHQAIDIHANLGDNVYASDSGTVIYAGWTSVGYGNLIVIDHADGWQTWYAHLSELDVSCGEYVVQGTIIGLAGSTGRSTGPHLHFEMRWKGTLPNPLDILP